MCSFMEFGPVVQKMLFKDISYLKILQPICSADQIHLCNFDRRYHEEQFCEIIFNLDQWFRRKCRLKVNNPYFEQLVGQIYPTELQLNKVNSSDTEAPYFDLNLSITNGIVSSKIYDKRDDFNFEIVNFPFLDGDVPRSPSYGVYISQLICFARVCSNVDDFNNRNLFLTAKLLKQG